jgi:hypothetical protein
MVSYSCSTMPGSAILCSFDWKHDAVHLVLKWFLPLVALFLTIWLLRKFNSKTMHTADRPSISTRTFTVALVSGLAITAVAHLTNLPHHLQPTNLQVLADKLDRRELCHRAWVHETADSSVRAESFIRDNTVGRRIHDEVMQRSRPDMGRVMASWGNKPFFFFGMCWSILPSLLHLFVASLPLPARVKPRTWESMLPVMTPVIAMTAAAFCIYHIVIVPRQASACLLASGHWYTWLFTTLASIIVMMHLHQHRDSQTVSYLVWLAIYQALAFSVLVETQRFHHDAAEALYGLRCSAMASPAVLAVGLMAARALTASYTSVHGNGAHTAPAIAKPLSVPYGWVVCSTDLHHPYPGQIYYHNTQTGETSWTQPPCTSAPGTISSATTGKQ